MIHPRLAYRFGYAVKHSQLDALIHFAIDLLAVGIWITSPERSRRGVVLKQVHDPLSARGRSQVEKVPDRVAALFCDLLDRALFVPGAVLDVPGFIRCPLCEKSDDDIEARS